MVLLDAAELLSGSLQDELIPLGGRDGAEQIEGFHIPSGLRIRGIPQKQLHSGVGGTGLWGGGRLCTG